MQRRKTNQRQIVFDVLEKLGHASSEQLIDYIIQNYDNISLATIYRNLTILLEEKLIKKVKLDSIDVYETVKENHYHFICNICHQITDIDPKSVNVELNAIENIEGNQISHFDLAFYGICKKCQK